MVDALARIQRTFWISEENRLRAPFRIPVTFGLLLLAARLVLSLLRAAENFVPLPDPVSNGVAIGFLAIAALGIGWFVDRRRFRNLGFELDAQWALDAVAGLAVGLGMVGAVVVILRLTGMATLVDAHTVSEPDLLIAGNSAATGFLYGLLFFGAWGVLEEILLRGYLLVNTAEGLTGYLPGPQTAVRTGILVTALVFGLLHAANPGGTILSLPNLTLVGVFLAITFAVTGRLAFAIGVHVAWNFALGSLFGLPISGLTTDTALVPIRVDGPTLVTGGTFGPEGGLIMFVALAVAVGGFGWWARRQHGGVGFEERIAIPDLWIDEKPED